MLGDNMTCQHLGSFRQTKCDELKVLVGWVCVRAGFTKITPDLVLPLTSTVCLNNKNLGP